MLENKENSLIQIKGNLYFSVEHYKKAIERCLTIIRNILLNPSEENYKHIKVKEIFTNWFGIIDVLMSCGINF